MAQMFAQYLLAILQRRISALPGAGRRCPWKVRDVTIKFD